MSQSLHQLYVHLVWATWDREPCLDADMRAWLWPALAEKPRLLGSRFVVVGGIEDHVHVLTELPAMTSVATLAQHLKGASSAIARLRLGTGALRWQGGYGAFTARKDDLPVLEAYIRQQQRRHATGEVSTEWEPGRVAAGG